MRERKRHTIHTIYFITSFFFILFAANSIWAEDSLSAQEFEVKQRYNEERIQDFYLRLNQIERADAERRRGEDDKRKERRMIEREYEKSRREYVLQRKEKPPEDSSAYDLELKNLMRERELARQKFVNNRDQMLKILRRAGDVPEEDEYDLNLTTEP